MQQQISSPKSKRNLIAACKRAYGNLCVDPLKRRHERHYKESPLHLAFDVMMVLVVLALVASNIFLWWGGGQDYIERIIEQTLPALSPRSVAPLPRVSHELELEVRPTIEAFGQTIGLGPHPPRPGEASTYWIFLRVKPQAEKITNVVVRGALAPGVRWTGNVSSGTGSAPTCNETCPTSAETGEFRWTIGDIAAAEDASSFSSLDAAFELALTPAESQATYPLLTYLEIMGKAGERELKTVIRTITTENL